MSLKRILFICSVLALAAGDNACPCTAAEAEMIKEEIEELRKFVIKATDNNEDIKHVIIPGELSPPVPCIRCVISELKNDLITPEEQCDNCITKERRKRKTIEAPTSTTGSTTVREQPSSTTASTVQRWPLRRKPVAKRRVSYYNGRIICSAGQTWIPIVNICANTGIYRRF